MRTRRTERFAEEREKSELAELIERNTFGGNKGTPSRIMPIVSSNQGIKMEWDRRCDEYPTTIVLKMTNGQWVKYRIEIEQPGFRKAMDIIRNPAHVRGYPSEK